MTELLKTKYEEQIEYETKDGSMVRELMHPERMDARDGYLPEGPG